MMAPGDPKVEFIGAALWHGSLERAEAILAEHPEIVGSDIHMAAILGDDRAVRRFLEADQGNATAKGGSSCPILSGLFTGCIGRERVQKRGRVAASPFAQEDCGFAGAWRRKQRRLS